MNLLYYRMYFLVYVGISRQNSEQAIRLGQVLLLEPLRFESTTPTFEMWNERLVC